ncbi:MAG: hypothetical protein JSR48_04030 [Verrucomicrobia bacterium]|nr:hypothetical protein [Verrucomicrobiota bacterium]
MTPARSACLLLLALGLGPAGHAFETRNLLLLGGATAGPAIVAVGERGTIVRSTDRGHGWTEVASGAVATLTGIAFAPDGRHGWAVGHDALILATTDGGLTWQRQWQGSNLEESFLDVLALDARRVIAVGAYGLYLSTGDGGKTWVRRRLGDEDYHLNRITRGPTGTLYLAGERGTLMRSQDAGQTWDRIDSPYDGSFYGILPLGERELLAHGLRGRIYRSEDDGATWTLVPNEQHVLVATAARLGSQVVVFGGQSRALFVSRDGGRTVTPWHPGFTAAVAELMALPDGRVLALGETGASILPAP